MSRSPLVSICIPTYNYARILDRAVESALAQTYPEVEVVLIDDGSTDNTEEVARRWASHPRFTFIRNERNLGLFGNFNRCFEVSRGDYVKVLCADDWLHPRSVEDAVALLDAHPNVAMTTSPGWLVDIDGEPIGLLCTPFRGPAGVVAGRRAMEAHADWGNAAGMPSHVLLRRSVIEEVGMFEAEFAPGSDVHLWLKVLARHDLGWVPQPRCTLRIHDQHAHRYGAPSESMFRLWEDMARRCPQAVDGALLERALYGEARHHLLYVVAHLLGLRVGEASRVVRSAGEHVSWRALAPHLAREVPGLARDQLRRLLALASGRLVIYGPRPRVGAPRAGVRAA